MLKDIKEKIKNLKKKETKTSRRLEKQAEHLIIIKKILKIIELNGWVK